MKLLLEQLRRLRVTTAAQAELANFVNLVNDIAGRVGVLSGSFVVFETLLEHHGLLTPEVMEAIRPKVHAKLTRPVLPSDDKPESRPAATEPRAADGTPETQIPPGDSSV